MRPDTTRIYLASASPRRHELLQQIKLNHEVIDVPTPSGADEPQLTGETASDYVLRTAKDKSVRALAWLNTQKRPPLPVLTADTTVILDHEVLHKPVDRDDAIRILTRLSGRTHEVRTAIVLATHDRTIHDVSITKVQFNLLSVDDIARYCDTQEPMGKAGAYGIQGAGGAFISRIEGTYTGVMGLPIYETVQLLKAFDIVVP